MNDTQDKTAEYIARRGTSSSVALFDPAFQIYNGMSVPGIIGYQLKAHDVIVLGDPLCDPKDMQALTAEFQNHFKSIASNVIYIATSEAFARSSLNGQCQAIISIGREIIINPMHDPRGDKGTEASHLRGKCNQAARHDIVIHEYLGSSNPELEQAMEKLGEAWVKRRKGPQVYLHHLDVFVHRKYKRFFYAEQHGKLMGLLILIRMDARKGWLLSSSLIDQTAPKGTSELLLVSTLDALRKDQCQYLTIGTVPTPKIQTIEGLGKIKSFLIRNSYNVVKRFFNLNERHAYWEKFHTHDEATYVVLQKPNIGLRDIMGVMLALNASYK